MAYISDFKEAHLRSLNSFGGELNFDFPIQPNWKKSLFNGIKYSCELLESNFDAPYMLDSECFFATMLMSVGFIDANIPHMITIGDVEYDSGDHYVKSTPESLILDIETGFKVEMIDGVPQLPKHDAHCWITLPNGDVIDPTISAHIDALRGRTRSDISRFEKMFYQSSNADRRVKRHIPQLTGLNYHMSAVTGMSHQPPVIEQFFDHYRRWQKVYCDFMRI